jgi:hypothetical protein
MRGAHRDRHERGAECGGRGCADRRAARTRTAKSCGPGAPMQALSFVQDDVRGDGGNQLVRRGEREISCKPPCREGRLSPPVPVVTRPLRNFSGARAPGACGHPAFPAPSSLERDQDDAKLGRQSAPRECEMLACAQFFDRAFPHAPTRPSRGRVDRA